MKIKEITILPGAGKDGTKEEFDRIDIKAGQKIGVVGATGSGKSQLLYDIEKLASGDTKSKRRVLVNGREASKTLKHDPKMKLIGYLTQHMNFLTDASVEEFLETHIEARGLKKSGGLVKKIIADANEITGEPISPDMNLLILSGGQSRALMVSDLAHVSNSPIILVDEIENAGIKKEDAMEILATHDKIVFIVTHDPRLALNTDRRLVMSNGRITDTIYTSIKERGIAHYLSWIENYVLDVREDVRKGKRIEELKLICTPI